MMNVTAKETFKIIVSLLYFAFQNALRKKSLTYLISLMASSKVFDITER